MKFVRTAAVMEKPVRRRDAFGVFTDVFPFFFFSPSSSLMEAPFSRDCTDEFEGVEKWRFREESGGEENRDMGEYQRI
ncbi:hypothetical protein TIFTF001_007030 [Ficus carica]|uniref:Uncharacterized protein n=1 Tax=Ficus carica TaxID=3494 RepID=A0AA87ZPF9_FICCA|nr:hypothetical protein TIFTF001_007030 [Ficus carica]